MHTGDAILRLICRAQPPVVLPCSPADIAALQQPDGSFWGDEWGETDTRFSYCALSALWLLDRLEAVDVPAAAAYVAACKNFDGGFGCTPGVCATCCRERGGGEMLYVFVCGGSLLRSNQGQAQPAGSSASALRGTCSWAQQRQTFDVLAPGPPLGGVAPSSPVPPAASRPAAGNESHAGQVFTCVAALDIAGRLDLVDGDLLCWW